MKRRALRFLANMFKQNSYRKVTEKTEKTKKKIKETKCQRVCVKTLYFLKSLESRIVVFGGLPLLLLLPFRFSLFLLEAFMALEPKLVS